MWLPFSLVGKCSDGFGVAAAVSALDGLPPSNGTTPGVLRTMERQPNPLTTYSRDTVGLSGEESEDRSGKIIGYMSLTRSVTIPTIAGWTRAFLLYHDYVLPR